MSTIFLPDLRATDIPLAGGKAASLGELANAGYPVPPGFVITAGDRKLGDVLAIYDRLRLGRVAVRSSGVGEDGKDQSWAGQFATLLHIQREGLLDAIQACWDSAKTTRVAAYAKGTIFNLAVLVQRMVHSDAAGVAFSHHPVTGNAQQVMIEAVYGLGEQLVQGLATPDSIIVDVPTGRITEDIVRKPFLLAYQDGAVAEMPVATPLQYAATLTHPQVQQIAAMTKAIEAHYHYPVDIEWAIQGGTLYLLQARPITTI
jgi:pyruvate,water dikinase